MLDYRLKTFLMLCREKSFTKTAEKLHMTQPAVSQHIQYLEKAYGTKLFVYQGKTLTLTPKGKLLRQFAVTVAADSKKVQEQLEEPEEPKQTLNFGATLTIGEFVMPEVLHAFFREHPQISLRMLVENTQKLLQQLQEGTIDFALIEGNFDHAQFEAKLLSRERFVAVCAKDFPLEEEKYAWWQLCEYPLIIREEGSGTRHILQQVLEEQNMRLSDFAITREIENFQAIKQLVLAGDGITFLYERVVKKELANGSLREIPIECPFTQRGFYLVHLKNSYFKEQYMEFFSFCQKRF